MNIPDVRDFDPASASRELLARGFTAVDDIGGSLYKHAEEDLFDELGFAADDLDITTDRIETDWGPVFVFRNRSRVKLKEVKALLIEQRRLR